MVRGFVRYPGPGCVVEFMQGNAPQLAWVLEEQNGRLRLLLPNRREMALQAARVLPWTGPAYSGVNSRDGALEKLEAHRQRREAAENDIAPLELWELAQGEVEKASADWFAEVTQSDPDVDTVAACGHALLKCKSHFRFQPPDFEVHSEAVVAARLAEQEAARQREALVGEGAAFLRGLWDAWQKKQASRSGAAPASAAAAKADALTDAKAGALLPEVAERLRRLLQNRLVDPDTQDDAPLWRALVQGLPDDPFLALYLAEAWGLVPAHYNFWMDRIDYAPGDAWSQEHSKEIDSLLAQLREGEAAEPSVGLPFISIDAATTRDVDDAFFIEALPGDSAESKGWKVTLALACPAACWTFDGELDMAVRQRASSIYLPEATYHMMPETLGTDAFSLLAGKSRPAFLVTCEIAADGSVLSCEPSSGTVRLAANLTYEQCEAVLNGEAENPATPYAEQLRLASTLAHAHRDLRLRNGAVIIERPDVQLILEENEGDVAVRLETDESAPLAHLLVSEMMVLVNAGLAAWAEARGITLLHRTQAVGIPPECKGIWTEPQDIARVARCLAPALLETRPAPHAGLGEKVYAPSTSPLRRYPDLLNEAQILHVLHEGSPKWTEAELNALLAQLSIRLDAVGQVQRSRPRYWKLLYFRQHSEAWWPAVVTDENEMSVTVNLPREQLIVRAKRMLFGERTQAIFPGQRVEVRLAKIRPLHNDFQLVETRDAGEPAPGKV